MRTIPRHLLIHSALLSSPQDTNAWRDGSPEETTLSCIRIDPCVRFLTDHTQRQFQASATLFYDCRNSRPGEVKFAEGQTITWEGREYAVRMVEPLFDGFKLHHWEVVLE